MLAQSLNATNNPKFAEEAVGLLRTAIAREPEASDAYAQLAVAYGRKGDLQTPTLLRHRPPLPAAILRLRASWRRVPRRACRSVRRPVRADIVNV